MTIILRETEFGTFLNKKARHRTEKKARHRTEKKDNRTEKARYRTEESKAPY